MLALNFVEPVPKRLQEILVGVQNAPLQVELDDGLHAIERGADGL
ncbi:hypothetical protein [Pandoraea apista]|nr:hypothetical protein [Pandoraea apista]